jgi:dihydrolipoamide dehydrogenase
MGGTCLNRGCIPSKLLIHSADVMEIIKRANLFGINVEKYTIDFAKIVRRATGIVDRDSDSIAQAYQGLDNPKLFAGEAKFVGPKTIQVLGETVQAEKILIATGTRPAIPPIPGLVESGGYITSDEALRLEKQPKHLAIIGGGYIAAELAHFFGSLGTKVSIVQRRDVLLPDEDIDIAKKFTEIVSRKHQLYLNSNVARVSKDGETFNVVVKGANKEETTKTIEADVLLVATGRTPNSNLLDLDKTGVKADNEGFVIVDKYLQTSCPGIFALGDAVGKYQFKHSANLEAQYVYNNIVIAHPEKMVEVDYTAMPHAIFSSPQAAGVGYTEQDLIKSNIQYKKAVYNYIDTAMGQAIEDHDGFVKMLASPRDGTLLGCHIIGHEASVLIHEVLVAMRAGLKASAIASTIHIHPALSEVVARAAAQLMV